MKKQILRLAFVAAMVGTIAAGCSSVNETSGSDTTSVDSPATTTTPDTTRTTPDTTRTTPGSTTPGSATNPQ